MYSIYLEKTLHLNCVYKAAQEYYSRLSYLGYNTLHFKLKQQCVTKNIIS